MWLLRELFARESHMEKDLVFGQNSLFSFNTFEDLDSLLEIEKDLSKFPVHPLYVALRKMSPDSLAVYLPKLSKTQRVAFLDLDIWNRDELDYKTFGTWLTAYANTDDDNVKFEFANGPHFALYLKSKFNVWTIDLEEPEYPEHDNYFLTDDSLLLFEFDKDFPYFEEVQSFVREVYSNLGVEKAYAHFFKIVSETHSNLTEEEYHFKKERLRDLGFLDYYEALAVESALPTKELIDSFIQKKKGVTGTLSKLSKAQTLPKNNLVSFGDSSADIMIELGKVADEKRRDFLKFNFIRLINSVNTVTGSLNSDSVSLASKGRRVRSMIELGFEYTRAIRSETIFDTFGFEDLYKVGLGLTRINQKKLKDGLKKFNLEDSEAFLGSHFLELLENSFDDNLKFNGEKINGLEVYNKWAQESDLFVAMLPFISKFHEVHKEMISSGSIQDSYYLNYTKEEMDFEVLLISCFANYHLGHLENPKNRKLGISISDARKFFNEVISTPGINERLEAFLSSFGMGNISGLSKYLNKILKDHLEGIDLNILGNQDFKHVGGPVILNLQ